MTVNIRKLTLTSVLELNVNKNTNRKVEGETRDTEPSLVVKSKVDTRKVSWG